MGNEKLAAIFFEMADLLELQGIPWKPRAYRTAAASLRNLSKPVQEVYREGGLKALEAIPGVGEGIGKKIVQFIETGKVKQLEKLKKEVGIDVEALGKVQGLGPKKMKLLFSRLGVRNVAGLKKAAEQHKIRALPGFGEKSETEILEGIAGMGAEERLSIEKAMPIANEIKNNLGKCKAVLKVEVAGSLRRKKATVHDIDVLVATNEAGKVMDFFVAMGNVKEVLMKGQTKSSVIVKGELQVDLRAVKPEQWGSALLYFTGSKQHNIALRKIAQKKGWKISEYGLFKGEKVLASKTEKEIYNALGMDYVEPTERENKGEIEKAAEAFRKRK